MVNTLSYTTNPNKRCAYCKGREVIALLDGIPMTSNLEGPINDFYRCKDMKECQANLEAENTQVFIREKGFSIVKDYDKTILEVDIE